MRTTRRCVMAICLAVTVVLVWALSSIRRRIEVRLAVSDCNALACRLAEEALQAASESTPEPSTATGASNAGTQSRPPQGTDRWGTPYLAHVERHARIAVVEVTSAGRDKRFGTADDVLVRRQFGFANDGGAEQ